MTESTRRIITAITIPAALAMIAVAPAVVAVGLLVWTLLGVLVAIPLCRIIANADRNRAREQADCQPVGEGAGQGDFRKIHIALLRANRSQDHA